MNRLPQPQAGESSACLENERVSELVGGNAVTEHGSVELQGFELGVTRLGIGPDNGVKEEGVVGGWVVVVRGILVRGE